MTDITPMALSDYSQSHQTAAAADDAARREDWSAYRRAMHEQRQHAAMSQLQTAMEGGDPLTETRPIGAFVSPEVELERRIMEGWRQEQGVQQVLDEHGISEIDSYWKSIVDRYKHQNESELINKPKNEQELVAQIEQLKPVTVDPNEVAEIRHRIVQMEQAAKAVMPSFSIWKHPKTRRIVEWINREAGGGGLGYLTSGEQPMELGAVGSTAMGAVELLEGVQDFGLNLLYGGFDLADRGIRALGGPSLGSPPTNYVIGDDGKLYPNSAKIPGFMEVSSALWAHATGENAAEAIGNLNRARELEVAQRNGFENVVFGASRVVGMGVGFGLPAGAAMATGGKVGSELVMDGVKWLGSLGMKGAQSERALKITQLLGGAFGAAAGNATAEAIAFGRHEGFGQAFLHGAAMAPALMALGAMGRRTEWFLEHRAKMPKRLAAALAGAVEGFGFGTMETLQTGALWDFLKDPNEETLQTYGKNILGFMVFKGLGIAPTPGESALDAVAFHVKRSRARESVAEQVARGEATPETLSSAPTQDAAALRELGELSLRRKATSDPGEAQGLSEQQRRLETKLDIEELGVGNRAVRDLDALESIEELRSAVRDNDGAAVDRLTQELAGKPQTAKDSGEILDLLMKFDEQLELRQGETGPAGEREGGSFEHPPTRQIEPTEGVEPVRASDVLLEMEGRPGRAGLRIPFTSKRLLASEGDPVRPAMRGGKLPGGGKGVEGVFKVFENLARTREGRDLVTASHEWSHAMQRHALGQRGKQLHNTAGAQRTEAERGNPQIEQEIMQVLKDYPGAEALSKPVQWMEVWAEWHARNLLGDATLDQAFPATSAFMRGWLAEPRNAAIRNQYQRIGDLLYRYNAQGSLQRVEQSIVFGDDKPTESQRATQPTAWQRITDQTNRALFDDMALLKRSQKRWVEAAGGRLDLASIIDDPARLYDALSMTANKQSEHFVMRGFRSSDGRLIPGLRSVLSSVKGKERDFTKYLVSVRNMQLFKRGKRVQLTPQDYIETVKQLQRANPEFRAAARGMKRWTDALVDYVARSGNLDAEAAQRIKDAYVVYVPFFRAIEGPKAHGRGRGVAERGTGLSRIEGSTYEIRDPLVAMQEVAQTMISKAHQNMVTGALYRMAAAQEAGGLATIVPRSAVPKEHPVVQILDAMERQISFRGDTQHRFESMIDGLRAADALDPQTIALFTQKALPTGERNIIAFTPRMTAEEISRIAIDSSHAKVLHEHQGKLQWLEVDTAAYEALMGIDKIPSLPGILANPVINAVVTTPAKVLRFFATGASPAFAVANAIRDMISQPMFSASGKLQPGGGFIRFVQGAALYNTRGQIRELYDELGIRTASFYSEGKMREVAGQHRSLMQKAGDAVRKWEELVSAPENFLRIKEFSDAYERAKSEGKTEIEARMEALEAGREITVNFARAGVFSRLFNQVTPYFNAALQGQRKLWKQIAFGGDAKTDVGKARVQRAAIANAVVNITIPSLLLAYMFRDEDWYQDLPEWRKIHFWNIKVGDLVLSVPKPFEAGILFGSIPEMLIDENPVGAGEALSNAFLGYLDGPGALIPAFLRASVEGATNFDLFKGREITPEWIGKSRIRQEQATFYTTETAKVLSHAFNGVVTPIQIEHWLGAHTAGASTMLMRSLDGLGSAAKQADALRAITPWNRFAKQRPHGQSRAVDDLYDLSDDLDRKEGSGILSTDEARLKRRVDRAKRSISHLRKSQQEGRMTIDEAERRSFEIASELVNR